MRVDSYQEHSEAYYQQPTTIETIVDKQVTSFAAQHSSHKWKSKLKLKSESAQANYAGHIEAFQTNKGKGDAFI